MEYYLPYNMPDSLSAAEVFGNETMLVSALGAAAPLPVSLSEIVVRLSALVLSIFYIVLVVRYTDAVGAIALSAVGGKARLVAQRLYPNASSRRNIELLLLLTGIAALTLISARGVELYGGVGYSFWSLAGVIFAAILATILYEWGMLEVVSIVCERRDLVAKILSIKILHTAVCVMFVLPFALLCIFSSGGWTFVWLGIVILGTILTLIIFIKETFLTFLSERVSIFHWILYLCTLELFPLSLLVAPILR